jgi:hypothetical protein
MRLFDTVILVEKHKVKLDEDCILGLLDVWKVLGLRLGPTKYKSPSGYCRKNTLGSLRLSERKFKLVRIFGCFSGITIQCTSGALLQNAGCGNA